MCGLCCAYKFLSTRNQPFSDAAILHHFRHISTRRATKYRKIGLKCRNSAWNAIGLAGSLSEPSFIGLKFASAIHISPILRSICSILT